MILFPDRSSVQLHLEPSQGHLRTSQVAAAKHSDGVQGTIRENRRWICGAGWFFKMFRTLIQLIVSSLNNIRFSWNTEDILKDDDSFLGRERSALEQEYEHRRIHEHRPYVGHARRRSRQSDGLHRANHAERLRQQTRIRRWTGCHSYGGASFLYLFSYFPYEHYTRITYWF